MLRWDSPFNGLQQNISDLIPCQLEGELRIRRHGSKYTLIHVRWYATNTRGLTDSSSPAREDTYMCLHEPESSYMYIYECMCVSVCECIREWSYSCTMYMSALLTLH